MALAGGGMCVWWLIALAREWNAAGSFPFEGGESFKVGVLGVVVFGAAWVWSLATSLAVLRATKVSRHRDAESQRTKQRDTEGTEKRTEDTEKRRERERDRQKRDERHTREKTLESRAGERTRDSQTRERDFLVTGTDTGVGKTVVAAGLILALRAGGRSVIGFKPVETGVEPGGMADSALLSRATGTDDALARPLFTLREALAPPVAADRAGLAVEREDIEARMRALRARGHAIVAEGAGGVAVPLAWGYTALDLAAAFDLRAVIVARAGLGTLNHVWLTAEALRARGIPIAAVILNGAASPPDLAEATNPAALARMLPGVRCIAIPRQDTADPWEVANRLAPLLASLIERQRDTEDGTENTERK